MFEKRFTKMKSAIAKIRFKTKLSFKKKMQFKDVAHKLFQKSATYARPHELISFTSIARA